jgi:hypothetical protein
MRASGVKTKRDETRDKSIMENFDGRAAQGEIEGSHLRSNCPVFWNIESSFLGVFAFFLDTRVLNVEGYGVGHKKSFKREREREHGMA